MKAILKLCILSLLILVTGCNVESLDSDTNSLDLGRNLNEESCETAFAYYEGGCFSNDGFNRWGWVIGPLSDATDATYDLYAGAGQCNLDNGTHVGTLNVNYADGSVTVDYNAFSGFGFTETHLYVGNDKYPTKRNGRPTVAPGQYGNQNSYSEAVGSDSYTINDLEGEIYIIAHAVVCEVEVEECSVDAGTLLPDANDCLERNGEVVISATTVGDAIVPDGFEVLYLLSKFSSQFIILENSDSPTFVVNDDDEYTIHTLIYDPNTFDTSNLIGNFVPMVAEQFIENGGDICGSIDGVGAHIKVLRCEEDN